MSARERRSRRGSFWRGVVADPLRKLLALALAVLLWIFLDSQVSDSKQLDFTLVEDRGDIAADAGSGSDATWLRVRVPRESYTIAGFRNVVTQEPIRFVHLTIRGPKNQLAGMTQAPRLEVTAGTGDINTQAAVFEFDVNDLWSPDSSLTASIVDMEPRRVAVVLERTEGIKVLLNPSRLRVDYPDETEFPDFRARLRLEDAEYSDRELMVRGPKAVIDQLTPTDRQVFRIDLSDHGQVLGQSITAPLSLLPEFQGQLRMEPALVTVRLPLDPRFEQYRVKVPVWVDTLACPEVSPSDLEWGREVEITLRVSGALAAKLSRMTPDELREWAHGEVRVVVRLPQHWTVGIETFLGYVWLADPHYHIGRDYQSDDKPPVQVGPRAKDPKSPRDQ